ncbi:MAG: type II CAAX endopeptidase family protein [Bryobacteraceae bacterium]|nr:type II CAAX endopeptidase family protein [Bryobacteraceae bacterium]
MEQSKPTGKLGILLRVGIFAFMEIAGLTILGPLMLPIGGYLVAAALSTFGAAAIANAVAVRVYERGDLSAVGLGWSAASVRNLIVGLAGGVTAALFVLAPALALGLAEWKKAEGWEGGAASIGFVALVLLFGAIGEELLFRGYGFQVLLGTLGRFATILPMAVLFGAAHSNNQNASTLGIVNTVLWGLLFCFAFLHSRDLWLPIGIHYGWNLVLPLFGANLSGFTMKVTGYSMHWKIADVWSGGEYGPEAGLLTTAAVVMLFAALGKAPVIRQVSSLYKPGDDIEAEREV